MELTEKQKQQYEKDLNRWNKKLQESFISGKRIPLMPLYLAQYAYGTENTTFQRPRYVQEGYCEWCGKPLKNKRQTSCCSKECRDRFNMFTSSVYYGNQGSASGYRNHIFRRDNYTCQECGTVHRLINENGIELPTTDGHLELHHIKPRVLGGDDNPNNLETICDICHKEKTKELMEQLILNEK